MEAFAKVGPILLLKGKDGTEKIILFPESTVGESATKANVPAPHASVPRIPIPLTPGKSYLLAHVKLLFT